MSNEAVKEALERLKTILVDAQSNLSIAQQRVKCTVDKKRLTEQFDIGNEVVLSMANLRTCCPHLPPKIKARWVGSFCIQKIVSLVAYGLDLPLGWWIHPVFHICKLKCYIWSEEFLRELEPRPPMLVGNILEYDVEGFSGIRALVPPVASVWYCGKGIYSPRLLESLKLTYLMLYIS